MPTTKKFNTRFLLDELEVLYRKSPHHVSDTINDVSRWSVSHTIIFRTPDQPEDEAWEAYYSVGATECQEESPWEHETEVEATLVKKVTKVVTVWERDQ